MKSRRATETDTPPSEVSASEIGARLIGALPSPKTVRLRGRSLVTATLPNGRTVWLRLHPSPVTIGQVNRLARAVQLADARHAVGARASALAIGKLARRVRDDSQRVARMQQKGEKKLRKKLASGDAKLHAKLDEAIAKRGGALEKETKALHAIAHRVRRRAIWDSVLTASSAPLFAAYGQRGRPFGTHQLTLAISLGVWLFGDELGDLLAGGGRLRPPPLRELDLWSYLAPAGNMLTGWWLLSDLQHRRFLTGILDLERQPDDRRQRDGRVVFRAHADLLTESLIDGKVDRSVQVVAPGHAAELESYAKVPVVATIASPLVLAPGYELQSAPVVHAKVTRGTLSITVTFEVQRDIPAPPASLEASTHLTLWRNHPEILAAPLRVAWIVDTREPK